MNEKIDASSSNWAGLVGMDSRVEDIVSLLSVGSDDVRLVGIWGMGGIGKTTIAKAVYNQIFAKCEGCCFLENVKEDYQRYGGTYLKEKLISQILGGARMFNAGFDFIKARLHSRKVYPRRKISRYIIYREGSTRYFMEKYRSDDISREIPKNRRYLVDFS